MGDIPAPPPIEVKAFVYNLYTSLNHTLEGKGNKQTQGAEQILLGAHAFNKAQGAGPLCFVQNIPINGFGAKLGYGKREY